MTGARPGEIARLNAADFDRKQKTLSLNGKTGTRTVAVSSDAAKFFAELSREAIGSAPMLRKSDGGRWDKDAWKKPIKIAANAAGAFIGAASGNVGPGAAIGAGAGVLAGAVMASNRALRVDTPEESKAMLLGVLENRDEPALNELNGRLFLVPIDERERS